MAKKTRKLFKKKGSQNWICQFQWRDESNKMTGYTKSLGTPDKELAWKRYEEIDAKIEDLKEGLRFTWSWERNSNKSKVEVQTVAEAFDKYIKSQESNGIKPDTIEGSKIAYNRMIKSKCASPSLPIKSLKGIDLESFKEYWTGTHAPNTINSTLNKIKAFLNYCVDKNWMGKYKSIKSPLKSKPISYFTDEEFMALMGSSITDEQKRAILFYRETGCRKREPFIAKRVGKTLIIPPLKRNPQERRIQLSGVMCQVHDEMMARFNDRRAFVKTDRSNWDWWYIALKKACKEVGIGHKTLHDLRDTFIVRLWAMTGDIHYVSTLVGHTDIKQTVEYARFTPHELLEHFPSLEDSLKPRIKQANLLMKGSVLKGSEYECLQVTDGEQAI